MATFLNVIAHECASNVSTKLVVPYNKVSIDVKSPIHDAVLNNTSIKGTVTIFPVTKFKGALTLNDVTDSDTATLAMNDDEFQITVPNGVLEIPSLTFPINVWPEATQPQTALSGYTKWTPIAGRWTGCFTTNTLYVWPWAVRIGNLISYIIQWKTGTVQVASPAISNLILPPEIRPISTDVYGMAQIKNGTDLMGLVRITIAGQTYVYAGTTTSSLFTPGLAAGIRLQITYIRDF
jgi:hypothetical protein